MAKSEFSYIELRIMQNLIPKKTHQDIAAIIGHPVEEVADYALQFLCKNKHVYSHQAYVDGKQQKGLTKESNKLLAEIAAEQRRKEKAHLKEARRAQRLQEKLQAKETKARAHIIPPAVAVKPRRQKKRAPAKPKKQTTSAVVHRESYVARQERHKLPTRMVDYGKQILVVIDRKTSIYINAGEDPVAAKEKYLRNLATARNYLSDKAQVRADALKQKRNK